MKNKYNWNEIQIDYDNGYSWDDLIKKYKMALGTIAKARKRGLLKTRSISDGLKIFNKKNPRKHSEETKKKISESRTKYLINNPDKVPYKLNHSSKMSYPEKLFQDKLIEQKISGWTYNFQFSIYSFDFAFPELKLDVEIDGSTHLNEKVIKIDKRRDEYSNKNGWTVLRFKASEIKSDIDSCITKLKTLL